MSQSFAKQKAQAPINATYITQTANGTLTNEQAMSSLATGYVKNTTTTGVQSIQAVPIPIADGGTNNTTAYTAGSVVFSDGTKLTQDNANLFWNDSVNELYIGGATSGAADILLGADGSVIINEQGNSVDTRIEGDTATNLFVVDGSADSVEIGTTVQGDIAKFAPTEITFNESGSGTLDFRVESDNQANALFVDASVDQIGVRTAAPHSTFDIVGGISLDNHNLASGGTETLDGNDFAVNSNPTALTVITLPDAGVAGRIFFIKKTGAISTLRITPDTGDTIDGVSGNLDLTAINSGRTIMSDGGTNWLVMASI